MNDAQAASASSNATLSPEERPLAGPREALLFLLAALVACVGPLWLGGIPLTHDGPQHLFMGNLAAAFDTEQQFGLLLDRGRPVTSLGFDLLFRAAEPLFGWEHAYRLVLSTIALVSATGFGVFLRSHPRAPRWLAWTALVVGLPWSFYMGFFSYTLALGLGWWILAAHRRGALEVRWKAILCSLALLVLGITHIFVAGLVGLTIGVHEVTTAIARRSLRPFARVVLVGLPVLVLALLVAIWMVPEQTDTFIVHQYSGLSERLWSTSHGWVAGPVWRIAPILLLGFGGTLAAISNAPRHALPDLVVIGLAWVGILVLPSTSFGWQIFPPRLVPFALGLALPWVGTVSRLQSLPAPPLLALAGWLLGASIWSFAFDVRTEAAVAGLEAILEADVDTREQVVFAVTLPPEREELELLRSFVPHYRPLQNLDLLWTTAHGGYPTGFFGRVPLMHPFVRGAEYETLVAPAPSMRFDPDYLDALTEEAEFALLTELSQASSRFDRTLVFAPESAQDHWSYRGFETVWQSEAGSVVLNRFVGCPLAIHVSPPTPLADPLVVEFHWAPLLAPSFNATIAPGSSFPPEGRVLPLPSAPCGLVWIHVYLDADRNGEWSRGEERACVESDDDGRITVGNDEVATVVPCTLTSASAPEVP